MPTDKNQVFTKAIIPWYHSKTAYITTYIIVMVCMFLVLLFGMAGISVARENLEYNGYVWVPVCLVVMSGSILIATALRFIKRFIFRSSK